MLKFIKSHIGNTIVFVILTLGCIVESVAFSRVVFFSLFIKFFVVVSNA